MNQELYFRKLKKELRCSRQKKAGVLEDLRADVREAISHGEDWEQVMERMGTPGELAKELNENMGVEGGAPMKRNAGKIVLCVLGAIVFLLLLAAFYIYQSLPKSYEMGTTGLFNPEEVEAKAQETVELLDSGDYEALKERAIDQMKPMLTWEELGEARLKSLGELGTFQKFSGYTAAEVKQNGDTFAVVELTVVYEERSVIYRISFDEEMKLAGFYMR